MPQPMELGEMVATLLRWRDMPRVCLTASAQITRADTASKDLFMIPAGHEAHALVVHGEVGSNASLTAGIDLGLSGGSATAIVAGHSVLGALGVGQHAPLARKLGVINVSDAIVNCRYAETGTASTTGGPWTVVVLYSKAGN